MPSLIPYPLVNGHRYSFASIEFIANGVPIPGAVSINYSDELEPADVYGTDPQKIGRTRGKRQSTCDFEMYKLEWEALKLTLGVVGVGYGETSFNIVVCHSEGMTVPVVTDFILGARVTKVENANAEGNEATKVKVTCNVMEVLLAGVPIAAPIALTG